MRRLRGAPRTNRVRVCQRRTIVNAGVHSSTPPSGSANCKTPRPFKRSLRSSSGSEHGAALDISWSAWNRRVATFQGFLKQLQGKAPTVAEKYDYLYKPAELEEIAPGCRRPQRSGGARQHGHEQQPRGLSSTQRHAD